MESVHWSRGDLGGAQKQIFVLIFDDLLCRLDEETINIESLTRLPTRHSSFSGNWSLSFHKPLRRVVYLYTRSDTKEQTIGTTAN